jgi:hypothetical protein
VSRLIDPLLNVVVQSSVAEDPDGARFIERILAVPAFLGPKISKVVAGTG